MTTVAERWGLGFDYDCCTSKQFVAGVECEIEAVMNPQAFDGFNVDKDGSLRDNGYEFISYPFPKDDLLKVFTNLHKRLEFDGVHDPFSFRTSTHVHINCATLESKQVKNIILLYALFEEFFFMMVKPIRRDNIHCVPLTETHLPTLYRRDLEGMVDRWHKYTALNVKPLRELGTIEFRHLHGTGDVQEFTRWLSVLENLWTLGQRVVIDAKALSNKDLIESWFSAIFSPVPPILAYRASLFDIIRNNLLDVKFSTI